MEDAPATVTVSYTRLVEPEGNGLCGLYYGNYGVNGIELVELARCGDMVVGRKVTGDPHVKVRDPRRHNPSTHTHAHARTHTRTRMPTHCSPMAGTFIPFLAFFR